MKLINFFMQIGTFLAAMATLPQIVAVYNDRKALGGYNSLASFGLGLAMVCFSIAFFMMNNIFSVLCEVPVAIFWFLAAFYSWKYNGFEENTKSVDEHKERTSVES